MAGPGNDENRNKAHEMLAMVNTCCYFYTKFGTKILVSASRLMRVLSIFCFTVSVPKIALGINSNL